MLNLDKGRNLTNSANVPYRRRLYYSEVFKLICRKFGFLLIHPGFYPEYAPCINSQLSEGAAVRAHRSHAAALVKHCLKE